MIRHHRKDPPGNCGPKDDTGNLHRNGHYSTSKAIVYSISCLPLPCYFMQTEYLLNDARTRWLLKKSMNILTSNRARGVRFAIADFYSRLDDARAAFGLWRDPKTYRGVHLPAQCVCPLGGRVSVKLR